jgi:hypothetical protein
MYALQTVQADIRYFLNILWLINQVVVEIVDVGVTTWSDILDWIHLQPSIFFSYPNVATQIIN